MFSSDYRQMARSAFKRAQALLQSDENSSFHYAALECRFILEALTYDRAKAYKDDLPEADYNTWQPTKLMNVMLSIDPTILMTSTIVIGRQAEEGKLAPRDTGQVLGTDTPLTLSDVKKRYDALGSFLHIPTIGQISAGKAPKYDDLRKKCAEVLDIAEKVLSSKVWNCTLGDFSYFEKCFSKKCGKPIRARFPRGGEEVVVKCHNENCAASYTVSLAGNNRSVWKPISYDLQCSTQDCDETIPFWESEIQEGARWQCSKCNATHELVLRQVRLENADLVET